MFGEVVDRKQALVKDYKNIDFNKPQNLHSFKRC